MDKKSTSIKDFHMPRWEEFPNVDLYLDQVVSFINTSLSSYISIDHDDKSDHQLLTNTMINNYAENSLIEPPHKKQYSKNHLAKLFAICVLKQVYSMQEIKYLIDIAIEDTKISNAYDNFCDLFEEALICTYSKKDFIDKNLNNDGLYLLKSVLLSCSYKIYVQSVISKEK